MSVEAQIVPVRLRPPVGHISHIDNVVVTVETADGVVGRGFSWLPDDRTEQLPSRTATIRVVAHAVSSLADLVVGCDVFDYERIWSAVAAQQVQTGEGLLTLAHSAIDMAVWDAVGRTVGQPLHKLLGSARKTAPFYSNELLMHWRKSPDEVAEVAAELVAAGQRGLKMPLGANPREHESVDIVRIHRVREAVGPDIAMYVDAGARMSIDKVLRLGRQLDDIGLSWLEDPVPLEQVENMRKIRRELTMPIAVGETVWRPRGFRSLLEGEALDVAIFEPMRVGGITGAVKVAALTQAFDIPIAVHVYSDLAAQLTCAFPNAITGEYVPWWGELFTDPLHIAEGHGKPSDEPGIGFTFAELPAEPSVEPSVGATST